MREMRLPMPHGVKLIRIQKTNLLFDPNVFELFVPKLTPNQENILLKEIGHVLLNQNHKTPMVYITRIYSDEFQNAQTSLDNKKYNTPEQIQIPIKILITYAGTPVLAKEKILIHNKVYDYVITETNFSKLADMPNILAKEKKFYYAQDEKEKRDNESRMIEGIRNLVSNGVFTSSQPPLPPMTEKPTLPIIIGEENIKENAALLEKRFDLEEGIINNPLTQADLKSNEYDAKLITFRKKYTEPIENDLESIDQITQLVTDQKMAEEAAEEDSAFAQLSVESRQKLKNYTQSIKDSLSKLYSEKKVLLLQTLHDKTSDQVKFSQSIASTADRVKNVLKEYNYGYAIEQLIYIKRCLIWSLYHAAINYLTEQWALAQKQFPTNTAKMIEFRKNELKAIDDNFKGIINISSLCQISSLDEAYAGLEKLSLAQLSSLTHQILIACDKKMGLNSGSLKCVVKNIREMNEEIYKEFKFRPFKIPNTYADKTGFYFESETLKLETFKNEKLEIAQIRLHAFNQVLQLNLSPKNAITIDFQNEFETLKANSTLAIESIQIYKRILLEEQLLRKIADDIGVKLVAINTHKEEFNRLLNIFDPGVFSLMRCEDKQFTDAIEQWDRADGEELNTELQTKIAFLKENIQKLSKDMVDNINVAEERKSFFNTQLAVLSKSFKLTSLELQELAEVTAQVLSVQKKLAANEAALLNFLDDFKKIEAFFKIPFQCKKLSNTAKNYIYHKKFQGNRTLNEKIFFDINKFYAEIKQQLANIKFIMQDSSLPLFSGMINNYIDSHVKKIEDYQSDHIMLIFAHIIANDLLNVKKWGGILNTQKIFKQGEVFKLHTPIHGLLRIVIEDKRFLGWTNDPVIAKKLMMALKHYTENNKAPNMPTIQHLYNLLLSPPVDHNNFTYLATQVTPRIEDNFLWLTQNDLSMITFPVKEEKKIEQIKVKQTTEENIMSINPSPPKRNSPQPELKQETNEAPDVRVLEPTVSPAVNIKTEPVRMEGFFKRHKRKILAGSVVAAIILAGALTCGVLAAAGLIGSASILTGAGVLSTTAGISAVIEAGAAILGGILAAGCMVTSSLRSKKRDMSQKHDVPLSNNHSHTVSSIQSLMRKFSTNIPSQPDTRKDGINQVGELNHAVVPCSINASELARSAKTFYQGVSHTSSTNHLAKMSKPSNHSTISPL